MQQRQNDGVNPFIGEGHAGMQTPVLDLIGGLS